MAVDKERFTAAGRGFSVRPARPQDLPAARALIMRVIKEDLGYDHNPQWHWDVDDLQGTYLDDPRHALWVAVDDASGHIVATGGLRKGGPRSAPEQWVVDRYDPERTAQVVRVYVAREHRRRGIARTLVDLARRFAAAEGGYAVICLHTDVRAPGAEGFWRAMPTTLVYDGRGQDPTVETLHFELPFPEDETGGTRG
jgi:ribosomal protein S18 acetylase RimI-like enzyme